MDTIAQHLKVHRRYMRSVSIERDIEDPGALEGYVITPNVQQALARLGKGLRPNSSQRAWRITGPYGTGKSALGLFVAHLIGRTKAAKLAMKRLGSVSPETAALWKSAPRLLPVIVTGTRDAFGRVLAMTLRRVFDDILGAGRKPTLVSDLDKFIERLNAGKNVEADSVHFLARFAEYASNNGYSGVLLVIDEMGKFLEYATLHPNRADIHIFQQVAELASGLSDTPIAVLGLLHQRFADYAAQFGRVNENEWGKVAERFEEVSFEESLDQYAFLLASAMQFPEKVLEKAGVLKRAKALYGEALANGHLAGQSRASILDQSAVHLYPIHPSVLSTIAFGMKRFGQNERSLFSFATSTEPGGLQDFAARTLLSPEIWFRLPDLYRYLAQGSTLRFRQQDRARKWELLHETLTLRGDLSSHEIEILMSVGLLNVLGPIPGVEPTAENIAFALTDSEREASVESGLASLVTKGVLFKRASGEYTLWQRGSVDLTNVYEEATRRTQADDGVATLLEVLPPARPIVAHRHYHATGTLRAFRVVYLSPGQAESLGSYEASNEFDGEVVVVVVPPFKKPSVIGRRLASSENFDDPRRLLCVRAIGQSELALFQELRSWNWVALNCEELRVDDYARAEVTKRVEALSQSLQDRLERLVRDAADMVSGAAWFHRGEKQSLTSSRSLSQKISEICDNVYNAAPVIRNELINRHKVSSAVASARLRLIDHMLTRASDTSLGIDGFPPERAIYLSLLSAPGIHRAEGARSVFQTPARRDNYRWLPAWNGLRKFLIHSGNVSFDKIFDLLAKPPYGIRKGCAFIFVLAFMLANRKDFGLFERGTFQVDLTSDHAQRLLKTPQNFGLHYFPVQDEGATLLCSYAEGLSVIRGKVANPGDFNATARELYRWFGSLSPFTSQTIHVSEEASKTRNVLKKAADPLELLFATLPSVFGFDDLTKSTSKQQAKYIQELARILVELDHTDTKLRERVGRILCDAFDFSGSVRELRDYLKSRCGAFAEELADYRLKAFIQRAADDSLSDEKWIDGMASLLTQKSLLQWDDHTIDVFSAEAKARAGQLDRWMSLLLDRVKQRESLRDMLGLFMTDVSGHEKRILVDRQSERPDRLKKLRTLALDLSEQKPIEAARLLAQLLAELLELNQEDKEKEHHGGPASKTHP